MLLKYKKWGLISLMLTIIWNSAQIANIHYKLEEEHNSSTL